MSQGCAPIHVVCAVIMQQERILIAQRPEGKRLAGYWEFPGGKIEPTEQPEDALHRELAEELGCAVTILSKCPSVPWSYEWGDIVLHAYLCEPAAGSPEPQAHEHTALAWRYLHELEKDVLAPADCPVLDWLLTYFRR